MGKPKPGSKAKAKASSKASAAPEPVAEEAAPTAEQLEAKRLWQQRKEATKWAQVKLEVVRGQLEAAQTFGKTTKCDWLQVAHEFHEVRLIRLLKRLGEKTVDGAPQELRDGVEAYLAQCAKGPEVDQETFQEHRAVWEVVEQDASVYAREAETAESEAAIEQLKAWTVAKAADVAALTALMMSNAASAGVQEAGLTRIGGLFSQQREGAEMPGLDCHALMPAIEAGVRRHLADPAVQRSGMAALRGVAMAPGQLALMRDAKGIELAVDSLTAQYKEKEVCLSATGAFWAMANAAGKASPELATMREAGVVDILGKVMTHHAWDQTLCGKVRVVLPFIQGE